MQVWETRVVLEKLSPQTPASNYFPPMAALVPAPYLSVRTAPSSLELVIQVRCHFNDTRIEVDENSEPAWWCRHPDLLALHRPPERPVHVAHELCHRLRRGFGNQLHHRSHGEHALRLQVLRQGIPQTVQPQEPRTGKI
ncbi:hypothetical protein CDAR_398481 [Caerostris darwini]|uniref:Uncharacterized protein n=1 Tax=Caerostris darwini TaxID=1538125 RepID=A0AAV4VF46_9ARAC|nr:hypothetical protein CDAR_398481 [Caerostris darwini]